MGRGTQPGIRGAERSAQALPMRIEFVLTGDELLSGQVTDTNSPWAEARLFETVGATVQEVVIVGDERADIIEALRSASTRADVVLVSGGLGPTSDDLTAACAADAQDVPLVEDPRVIEHLRARFARGNFVLSANNLRQALVPEGAEVILNPVGSAPMFIQQLGRAWLFYVPGVPREYRTLVEDVFLPRVRALIEGRGQRVHRAFRLLKVMGLAESLLDARVEPVRARHPRVQFGFRTKSPENQLKLLAEGDTQAAADAALAAAEAEVRPLLEPQLFGQDGEGFAEVVLGRLRAAGHTVAVAESCTGGMLSALLTNSGRGERGGRRRRRHLHRGREDGPGGRRSGAAGPSRSRLPGGRRGDGRGDPGPLGHDVGALGHRLGRTGRRDGDGFRGDALPGTGGARGHPGGAAADGGGPCARARGGRIAGGGAPAPRPLKGCAPGFSTAPGQAMVRPDPSTGVPPP